MRFAPHLISQAYVKLNLELNFKKFSASAAQTGLS